MTTSLVATALVTAASTSSTPADRGAGASDVVTADLVPVAARKKRMVVVQQNTDAKQVTFDAAVAKARSAQAITLQEVCKSWVDSAKKARWTVAFTPTTKALKCDNGTKRKGVAVIIPKAVKRVSVTKFKLKADIGRTPKLLCVNYTRKGVRTHVCSTHLVAFNKPIEDEPAQNADKIRRKQVTQIRNKTRKWIKKGDLVVVGGDFNAVPKSREMSAMYGGLYTEVNQLNGKGGRQGEETTDPGKKGDRRKIDYVFFSRNRVPVKNWGKLEQIDHPEGHAGHWMMIAKAAIGR
ncbi:endonuclease/exonuclease/phosphatase family protein [Nocardioides gilvus]|uniref:endonuclease/exonuclease/phosphatase family protein n=1 Tax=Nocardioides gilvus TaxID=1735589 RepID=UPI0013A551AC|nr:endonuclease/exonuclease/phosphatase family protein [Nocardioides gilvus]